jgi:hypothetical protein
MHLTLKKRIYQARREKLYATAGPLRPLHRGLQQRTASRSSRHEMSGGGLSSFASPRPYPGLPDINYSSHDRTIVVTHCGRICLGKKKINFSTVFAGQAVGIKSK